MNYEEIGNFISELRKEKGLTQKSLAEKLKVTDKAVSKWERGLGCPDVSILEDLSNVLDVSILEILKGRKINKEILNNYSNDYIIDTINYSKHEIQNKYKTIVLNILTIIIIVVVSILTILNIYHICYLKQTETYDFSSNDYIKNVKETLNKINKNIDTIKTSKLLFTEKENGQLLKTVEEQYKFYIDYPILNYEGKVDFTINDLYILDHLDNDNLSIYFAYETLEKYNSNLKGYKEHYLMNLMYKGYNDLNSYNETFKAYKYRISNTDNPNYISKIESRIFQTIYNIEELLILTDNIIKVGAQNE